MRNDLDLSNVGQHKVDAVANRIDLIQPSAEVVACKRSLGGQEATSDVEAVISVAASTDMLIDATAESSAFNYLCAVQEFPENPSFGQRSLEGALAVSLRALARVLIPMPPL